MSYSIGLQEEIANEEKNYMVKVAQKDSIELNKKSPFIVYKIGDIISKDFSSIKHIQII